MNTLIQQLEVYVTPENGLAFDDHSKGLIKEHFVAGIDSMLFHLMRRKRIENRFILTFSPVPFPNYDVMLEYSHHEYGGNWYNCKELNTSGWLCPALYHYFDIEPMELFVSIKPVDK